MLNVSGIQNCDAICKMALIKRRKKYLGFVLLWRILLGSMDKTVDHIMRIAFFLQFSRNPLVACVWTDYCYRPKEFPDRLIDVRNIWISLKLESVTIGGYLCKTSCTILICTTHSAVKRNLYFFEHPSVMPVIPWVWAQTNLLLDSRYNTF